MSNFSTRVVDFYSFLQKHKTLHSLPPLPEDGEVADREIIDDPQHTARAEDDTATSRQSANSSDKETESEAVESSQSPPSAASPTNKRKRDDLTDTGTSPGKAPVDDGLNFDIFATALVSS